MKRYLPYILIVVIVAAVVMLFTKAQDDNPDRRKLNKRISLRKRDKIPYGTFVAYQQLQHLFPQASLGVNRSEPGYLDSLTAFEKQQALIIIAPRFAADEYEMKSLLEFIRNGNDVFISATDISDDAAEMLNCEIRMPGGMFAYFSDDAIFDTLTVSLAAAPFGRGASYTYPGKQYDAHFTRIDTSITTVLGYDGEGRPDFIRVRAGAGNLYLHLAPLAFSNYFLLYGNNIDYYEKVFSLLPRDTRKIGWDEYYYSKKAGDKKDDKRGWLLVFLSYPSFRAGLITLLLALLVYTLLEMRRKQRPIPVVKKPGNDSLDFVKTIGRLYHDKGDHANLARKMAAYFLEYVRNRYKLPTTELNDAFVKNLHIKTGADIHELEPIVYFIRELDGAVAVSDRQLAAFHKQLESFYKKA
ncbi:MAG: DUF4350 domain-containing protein [Chitinophagaceae bacterium]